MRYFFDTEFIEDEKAIELISIGIAAEDGRLYYAETEECDLSRASEWVRQNVIPYLDGNKKPRAIIAEEVKQFLGSEPELWANYAAYDWVALCQLYGTMIDIPKGWPYFCRDIQQHHESLGSLILPKQKVGDYNALADALWCKEAFEFLSTMY